jgi:hypothetical protein
MSTGSSSARSCGCTSYKRLPVRYDRADIHEAFLAIGYCLVCYRRLKNASL